MGFKSRKIRALKYNSITIKQLIKLLQKGEENATVYVRIIDDNGDSTVSDSVGISFDDCGDVEIYEAAK